MSYIKDAFQINDRVYITADHLIRKGHKGTISRWVNNNVYVVHFDDGVIGVIKDNEMQNITGREDD